jgi:CelD/BcsL family acetyltransferase involved in cellulose biosynthesis
VITVDRGCHHGPSMAERVEWVVDPARFGALEGPWDELARGRYEPFLRHSWFRTWWEAFGQGRELCTCALWRGQELAAVMPLYARSRSRLAALANIEHSPLFEPLAQDGRALAAVASAAFARAPEVLVEGLPADSPALSTLVDAAQRGRRIPLLEHGQTSPITDTSGDFDEYRQKMKRNWRETERRRRKLVREHDAEFRLISTPGRLEEELQRGLELEASGWKGKNGTAILSSTATQRFYRSIAALLHARGELTFSSLSLDGRLVAFDLAFVHGSRYYLLKTAYDEGLRTLAPGLVLRLAVVERCFEMGLEAHEFLGPDMEWKRLFSTGTREHRNLRAFAWRPLPVVHFLVRRRARPAARWVYRRWLAGSSAHRPR